MEQRKFLKKSNMGYWFILIGIICMFFIPPILAADLVFSGKVLEYVDDATLKPMQGWRVDLYNNQQSGATNKPIDSTVTDKDGQYQLILPAENVPQGGASGSTEWRIELDLYNGYKAKKIESVGGIGSGVGSDKAALITYRSPLGGKVFTDNNFILEIGGGGVTPGSVLLSVGSIQGSSGTAQLPVTITSAKDIGNIDMQLDFSSCSDLKYVGLEKGSVTQNSLVSDKETGGKVSIGIIDINGINGDGSLVYLKYTITSQNAKSCTMKLTTAQGNKLDGSAVKFIISNGKFTSGVTQGDVDKDGKITSVDALWALQMSTGEMAVDMIADVNGDGKITSLDAIEILKNARNRMAGIGSAAQTKPDTGSSSQGQRPRVSEEDRIQTGIKQRGL